jgi:Fe-S cluster assembly iron-binding protein IscA
MLKVTDGAKQELKKTLSAHTDDPEVSLRLETKSTGQLGLVLDKESEGDQVVEHEGMKLLLIASELAPTVDGVTLDVQDTPDGPKLALSKGD